jgi:signal transduction histidine kinase
MTITSRNKAIFIFIFLCVCSIGLAVALNITWLIRWREVGMVVLGILFFAFIIAVLTMNTVFLVREIRRNEQQDSFLNAVTHELKTPIASIRLYLQTLESHPVDEEQRRKFYAIMLEDSGRLLATVEQVLKAGELAHKSRPRELRAVDLAQLAAECATLAATRYHLDESAIPLRNYTMERGAFVMGDAEELRMAVLNVLDNAVKYSPAGPQIVMTLQREGTRLLLRVADHGAGIPRPELKRIFRRFYRVPQRLRAKGTGLGLFIVRSTMRRHGGDASAESPGSGLGTVITLSLPGIES